MKRLGILGGSFNPPHKGHIHIACEAMKGARLDRVVLIPCGTPPHKDSEKMTSADDRLEMTRICAGETLGFEVLDLEIKDPNPSYTVNTLKKLKSIYPDERLCFIVGGDSLSDMETWYNFQEIFKLAEIIALSRGSIDGENLEKMTEYYKEKYGAHITPVDIDPIDISSSKIRKMIWEGKDIREFVTPKVFEYIEKFEIYESNN